MRSQMTSIGAGLIASVIAHLMLISVAAIPGRQQTAHGETVTVELVRPEDAPAFEENPAAPGDSPSETPKADTPKPDAQPDFSKLQVSPPVPNPEILQQQARIEPGMALCYIPFDIGDGMRRSLAAPPATLLVLPNGWVKVAAALPHVCADLRRETLADAWRAYRDAWRQTTVVAAAKRAVGDSLQHADANRWQRIRVATT